MDDEADELEDVVVAVEVEDRRNSGFNRALKSAIMVCSAVGWAQECRASPEHFGIGDRKLPHITLSYCLQVRELKSALRKWTRKSEKGAIVVGDGDGGKDDVGKEGSRALSLSISLSLY